MRALTAVSGVYCNVTMSSCEVDISTIQQQQLRNKTLFNSCERLLLGTFISGQLQWKLWSMIKELEPRKLSMS